MGDCDHQNQMKGWVLSNMDKLKKILRKPFHPIVGGSIVGLISIFLLWFNNSPWGISQSFARWGTWLAGQVGWQIDRWEYWELENLNTLWTDNSTWINLGIITGAFLAATLAKEFKIKKIKSLKQVVAAVGGGWLMGYGARVAMGCNIGGLLSSIASFSLSGWLFGLGALIGVYLGTKILLKCLI